MTRAEAMREWPRVEHELADATANHRDCFFALFPVGCEVLYRHGDHEHRVEVVEQHQWLERLLVRNPLTRRKFWLDGSRIVIPNEVRP